MPLSQRPGLARFVQICTAAQPRDAPHLASRFCGAGSASPCSGNQAVITVRGIVHSVVSGFEFLQLSHLPPTGCDVDGKRGEPSYISCHRRSLASSLTNMDTVHTPHSALPPDLVSLRLGVWRVILRRRSINFHPFSIKATLAEWTTSPSTANVIRLFHDIYSLGPFFFFVTILSNCLSGVEGTIVVWSSNRLLHLIEEGYRNQKQDGHAIAQALFLRIFSLTLISSWHWIAVRTNAVLSTRVRMHFEERILRGMYSHLNIDLVTSQKNSGAINADPLAAWEAFMAFLGTLRVLSTTISQLFLVTTFMKTWNNSFMPLLLCILWPVVTAMSEQRTLWTFIAYVASEPYKRLKALRNLAMHKSEVIGGGLSCYIMDEYRKAQRLLGDTSSQYPWELYSVSASPLFDIGARLMSDFPLIYYASECIRSDYPLSIASLATLQQLCVILESTVGDIIRERDNVIRNIRKLKDLYYDPTPQQESPALIPYSSSSKAGMGLELRDVSFQYPNAETIEPALCKVSFSIPPSSLVVIVGENGSGKSSLINILAGLYEPTSGEILIDGLPARYYRRADLQASISLLAQNHNIFNLSLAETIGIGDPDSVNDMNRIEEAARLGGAYELVQRYNAGFDEVLQPVITAFSSDHPGHDHQLRELLDDVERQKDVSGGEKQRISASRTFMRLMSGKINFVVVDEPTSAMDPLGEFELFRKLRSARAGKTMVFVTHRFGHLTKYADLILCMKSGRLIEKGTHQELMERNGEYRRLYDIQAKEGTESASRNSKQAYVYTAFSSRGRRSLGYVAILIPTVLSDRAEATSFCAAFVAYYLNSEELKSRKYGWYRIHRRSVERSGPNKDSEAMETIPDYAPSVGSADIIQTELRRDIPSDLDKYSSQATRSSSLVDLHRFAETGADYILGSASFSSSRSVSSQHLDAQNEDRIGAGDVDPLRMPGSFPYDDDDDSFNNPFESPAGGIGEMLHWLERHHSQPTRQVMPTLQAVVLRSDHIVSLRGHDSEASLEDEQDQEGPIFGNPDVEFVSQPRLAEKLFQCSICFEKYPEDLAVLVEPCLHSYCRECMETHINTKLQERQYPVICPVCSSDTVEIPSALSSVFIQQFGLKEESRIIMKELQEASYSILIHCRGCDRETFLDRSEYDSAAVISCPFSDCSRSWCKQCSTAVNPLNPKHSCGARASAKAFARLVEKKGWKYCPGCRTPTSKQGGCNHMTCITPGCNTHFCYVCGDEIGRGNSQRDIGHALLLHYARCSAPRATRRRRLAHLIAPNRLREFFESNLRNPLRRLMRR
ncbi:hypothetical protein NM688_g2377 [Phlebia brevispora]|uniref:Uncharacterized protein n=1 Tax=Phlebia brevispora TaxID=194682 RepID=A0ACC1T914_9APHY|nr:hypothetical protein NM688_g2377 [Phlebia brevispora]